MFLILLPPLLLHITFSLPEFSSSFNVRRLTHRLSFSQSKQSLCFFQTQYSLKKLFEKGFEDNSVTFMPLTSPHNAIWQPTTKLFMIKIWRFLFQCTVQVQNFNRHFSIFLHFHAPSILFFLVTSSTLSIFLEQKHHIPVLYFFMQLQSNFLDRRNIRYKICKFH